MTLRRAVYYTDLLRELIARDFKVRYKRSLVGFLWTFANPLLYLSVFYFVFRLALDVPVARFGPFAFTGILVWTWFQTSILQAIGAIVGNRELIRTPNFTAAVLPLVSVVGNLLHFLAGLLLFIVFLFFDGSGVTWALLLVPGLIVLQAILTLAVAYAVAAVNVSFRDVGHLVAVLLQLLFFMTPIFYDARLIPSEYQALYRLNPMVTVVEAYRSALLGVGPTAVPALLLLFAISSALLYFAYHLFLRRSSRFAEEL